MRNFLIFLGIIAVGYLATIDTIARFKELEKIAANTPSQIEMKSDISKSKGNGMKQQLEQNFSNTQSSRMQKKRTDNIKEQTQTVKNGIQNKYHKIETQTTNTNVNQEF